MSGKLSRKERAALQSQQAKESSSDRAEPRGYKGAREPKRRPISLDTDRKLIRNLNWVLILLVAIAYGNSLANEYALDDYSVILENTQTKQGYHAFFKIFGSAYREGYMGNDNALYRPLSKAMFALEYSMTQGPGLNHFMNVVLFGLSVVLLFRMLRLYLKGNPTIPFLASALFAVHPIHTEVVANIKGRDDILCFLFFVVTAIFVYRYITTNDMRSFWLATVSMALCYLSKESAITFIAVIPLMVYLFTDWKRETFLPVGGMLAGVTVLFLLVRWYILRNSFSPVPVVDNYIAGIHGFLNQRATAVAIAGIYLWKLIIPHPLVCDASLQQIPAYGLGDWQFLVPFVIFLGALVFAIMKIREKNIVAFAILYFFITFSIVSNIPFLLGTNYGERLMYAPSLGFCLILAWAFSKLDRTPAVETESSVPAARSTIGKIPYGVTFAVIAVFIVLTVVRNGDWHDNETLYSTDVKTSTNSCKLHYYYGNHITQQEYLATIKDSTERAKIIDTAMAEFKRAVTIYPGYSDAIQKLAEMYYEKKQYDSADVYYQKAIHNFPSNAIYRNNYGRMLFTLGKLPEAIDQFKAAIRFNPGYATAYNNLAGAVGTQGANFVRRGQQDIYHQQEYYQRAMTYYQQSVDFSLKAIALDPYFTQAYSTVAMTYQNMGDNANAQKYSTAAQQLQQSGQGHN